MYVTFLSDSLIPEKLKKPQRLKPSEPLSTPLSIVPGSIDFATRVAKIIAKKSGKPAYVSCSAVFGEFGIEAEMAGVKAAVEAAMKTLDQSEN